MGYAYVMNKTDDYIFDDPREKALRDAVHRAIAKLERGDSRGGQPVRVQEREQAIPLPA